LRRTKLTRFRGDGWSPGRSPTRFPYLASPSLVEAVNMAIVLERPLLVEGPPGCGKTRLASAIAHELKLPFHEWFVKSTSKARDGLYVIDMLRRLQDAQMRKSRAQSLTPYIRFGPLGRAIQSPRRSVVLVDEIDKADLDFPNDLLREIEERKFTIEELHEEDVSPADRAAGFQRTFTARSAPVIVVTSNREKELPDAFLRRCLYFYIEFPDPQRLAEIVRINTADLALEDRLIELAIDRILRLAQIDGVKKQPSTSEIIDWVRILYHWGIDAEKMARIEKVTDLPFREVLLKYRQDHQRIDRLGLG
jgi:MoxR-like ATPase